jgi:hypothetical protein
MVEQTEIRVRTPGGVYGVVVERGVLSRARAEIERVAAGRPWVVLTDNNVWKHWGRDLTEALGQERFGLLRMPAGEQQKRLATIEHLCEQMVKLGADRGTMLIAFGGGVVGDIGGFLASVYLRDAMLDTPDTADQYRVRLHACRDAVDDALNKYIPIIDSPGERETFARLQAEIRDFWATVLPLVLLAVLALLVAGIAGFAASSLIAAMGGRR